MDMVMNAGIDVVVEKKSSDVFGKTVFSHR
jgi:hypothetical protein